MKFQKLRLVGFKSFAEPSEFLFESGLTGIVGPNGCGKSNLVEALRWVMGESSYKSLRASGMDDVIFSGSSSRPGRNTAEITLFLVNDDRRAPAEFNDSDILEVSRRIERDLGSTYKINGRDVRARDVQLLFADASTGYRSNALVRQGQISELIEAKPTSRRVLLEEAAGISGLHSRRHEAELRLKGTESNLERLEDVLAQIGTQIDNLNKQTKQANRYRKLATEIRKYEATILYSRWNENQESLAEIEKQFAEAQSTVEVAASAQKERATAQSDVSKQLPQLREKSSSAGELLQRHRTELEGIDTEEKRINVRTGELKDRLTQFKQDIQREERIISENAVRFEELEKEKKELESHGTNFDEQFQVLTESVNAAQEGLKSCESKFEAATAEQAKNSARKLELEKTVEEGSKRVKRLEEYCASISEELEGLSEKIGNVEELSNLRKVVEEAETELTGLKSLEQSCEKATLQSRESEKNARTPLVETERKLSAMETEARTLRNILGGSSEKQSSPILDSIKVEPGLEIALGAALGDDLDAPVDKNHLVHWSSPIPNSNDPALLENIKPLSTLVDAPAELSRRLAQIGVVDRSEGETLQKQLKPGQRLVSKEGDLWRWDGFVVGADAKTPAAQRLEQRNRLVELSKNIEETSQIVVKLTESLEKCQTQVKISEQSEQNARSKVREFQESLDAKRSQLLQAENKFGQLTISQKSQLEVKQRAESELKEARESLESVAKAIEESETAQDQTPELEQLRLEIEKRRNELAEERGKLESVARERQSKKDRFDAVMKECTLWQERKQGAEAQLKTLRERHEEAEQELEKLIRLPNDFELKRKELREEILKAEENFNTAQAELKKGELAMEEADKAEKVSQEKLSSVRESLVRAEERKQSAQTRSKDIARQIRESLGVEPDELKELAGIKDGKQLPDVEQSERRLEQLKSERERLGGVNLLAETELNELTEQKETMVAERDDLIEAIRKLRQGIANLNTEARKRLLVAFDKVNTEFKRLFIHLFGGGAAELKLIDSEDPLEAGLEIFARPPGKKPQAMTLLSGGEQALTCIALIFAVFLTNPAPVCVLDEVDAPLDDANVERYCNLLNEMAKTTQTRFVIITHNPITMSRMDRLFGVTMAERGVSQMVSVDLKTAEQYVET